MRTVAILALTVPLAGCFSMTAPKPLPEWAMSPHAETHEQARPRASRSAATRRTIERTGSIAMPTNTYPVGLTASAPMVAAPAAREPSTPTAFTPEWQTQEQARDDALRRRMNICNGC